MTLAARFGLQSAPNKSVHLCGAKTTRSQAVVVTSVVGTVRKPAFSEPGS